MNYHISIPDEIPGKPGDIIDVPVVVTDGTGIQAGMFLLNYDPKKLKLEPHVQTRDASDSPSVLKGTLLEAWDAASAQQWFVFANVQQDMGFAWVGFFNTLPLDDSADEGSLILLRFKIKTGISAGPTPLTFNSSMQMEGANAIPKPTTWDNGSVLVGKQD